MPRVEVVKYDADWPRAFERIYATVWPAVQHAAMSLQHIGSTSVPGLCAKPVVDACIVVASRRDIPHVVKVLEKIHYVHRGDLGVPEREAFRSPPALPKHRLYASHRSSLSLKNHLGFRDYLRAHPDSARKYGELKMALAAKFPDDIDSYIAGKTEYIVGILQTIGFTSDDLATIRSINTIENLARPLDAQDG